MADKVLEGDRLRRLMDVGRGLVSNLDLEAVLQQLVEVGRELTGAQYAALGILDAERRELERFITLGIDEATRTAIGDLPRGHGVLGELIRDARPLRLDDVGSHPHSYGFPVGHPPMRTFLGVPVMIRGEAFGNLYLTEKRDGPFDEADEETATMLAEFAAIAIENARLYEQAESRRTGLEKAVRRLEATTEMVRALGGDTDLPDVLELIAKRGRALVDAEWLVILLDQGGKLEVSAIAGAMDQHLLGSRLPLPDPVTTRVIRERRPHRMSEGGEQLNAAGAALLVPLVFRGQALGAFAVCDGPGGRRLTDDDERLLVSFAAGAANAVHSAKSVEAGRLRLSIEAAERERRRWALELHDETLQGLGGLQVLLSSALRGPAEKLGEAVRGAIEQLTVEIAGLRRLITELRPAALDELGLAPAIETLAERTATAHDLTVETNIELGIEAGARFDPEVESTLYRLAQEALTNVVKHAGAKRVEIRLVQTGGGVGLTVSDDGAGFDPDGEERGFGLIGMRERVALAGGRLDISSEPGRGTTLRADLPAFSPNPVPARTS